MLFLGNLSAVRRATLASSGQWRETATCRGPSVSSDAMGSRPLTLPCAFPIRFNFFVNKILPQYRDAVMSHTLVYVPSYFDFVRLRNYFKKEELNFTHICEYTQKSGISRARHFFLQGEKQFLLLTERFHFYKR